MSFRSVLQFTDPVFPLGFMIQAHGMQTRNLGRNYELHVCVDQENKGSKIFITSLGSNRGRRFQFKQTFKFSLAVQ